MTVDSLMTWINDLLPGICKLYLPSGSPDGDAPVTVYFTDTSEGMPNAWSWDFGDGHTSYLQNPVHIFTDGVTLL